METGSYKDTSLQPEERAKLLLKEMDLEEKLGQVVGYNPAHGWNKEVFSQTHPQGCGQVALNGGSLKKSIYDIAKEQREIQDDIMALSKHHIPAIFHIEGICGAILPMASDFPSGMGQGATWDPAQQERMAARIGKEARAAGASEVFAPVLDVADDPRFGRHAESYGEDPALCAAMGAAYVKGLQGDGTTVLATAKHFVGFHASSGGIHGAACEVTERRLKEVFAKPFQAAITLSGLRSVMSSYNALNHEPVSGSKRLLTGLLRDEMGMDGYVVSDYNAITEIHGRMHTTESLTDAGQMAMEAGVDAELPFTSCYNQELLRYVKDGKMEEAVLDQAVLRTLTVKFRLGLFEQPYALPVQEMEKIFGEIQDELMLTSARESMVLLKNDGILPLDEKNYRRVAVIGCHAGSTRSMFGGYTFMSMTEMDLGSENTMAGIDVNMPLEQIIAAIVEKENQKPKYPGSLVQMENPEAEASAHSCVRGAHNLFECLVNAHPELHFDYAYGYPCDGTDESGFEQALKSAEQADLVIMTIGTKYGTGSAASEGEGIDSVTVGLPSCQEEFLRRYHERVKKPTVIIHVGGRPVSSDMADSCASALIEAWTPGRKGVQALEEILFGKYNPGGKLPVTVAKYTGQVPIHYNHLQGSSYDQGTTGAYKGYVNAPHEPRYYFGSGLSYTEFAYTNLELEKECWNPDEKIAFRVSVTNTGNCAGDEIVQIYIKDEYASLTRPVMELAGFSRVHLLPGQYAVIHFYMKASQLAFLDKDMLWKVEAGKYTLMAAAASNDIRLEKEFSITKDLFVDGRTRGFFAESTVQIV